MYNNLSMYQQTNREECLAWNWLVGKFKIRIIEVITWEKDLQQIWEKKYLENQKINQNVLTQQI